VTCSIELVAIGDRVEIGRYRLVARFCRALIFALASISTVLERANAGMGAGDQSKLCARPITARTTE
jgi:hypothetical protein